MNNVQALKFSPESKSPIETKARDSMIDEEMLNTFTIELAHCAYFCISRLTSGYEWNEMTRIDYIYFNFNNLSKNI